MSTYKAKGGSNHSLESRTKRFWSKVNKTTEDGCWLWTGGKTPEGYGRFMLNRKRIPTHRFSYLIHQGEIPDGLCVCHTCDHPPCVNPAHLFLADNRGNIKDRDEKGRQAKGETQGSAKVTTEEVKAMRELYATGMWTKKDLAAVFHLGQSQAGRILRGEDWRHLI